MKHPLEQRIRHDRIGLAVMALVLVALELTISNQFHRSVISLSMIFAIAAIGLGLLVGFTGIISIGQGAFIGIGAYVMALSLRDLGVPAVAALIPSALIPALIAYVIGRPILRLSGIHLAMATLAFGATFYIIASQWRSLTGGIDPGIPSLPSLPGAFGLSPNSTLFYLIVLILLGVTYLALTIVHSRHGRALMAVSANEGVAAGFSVDVVRLKTNIFCIAAGFSGLAGGLLALYLRSFNAGFFGVGLSIELLMMVIIGALTSVWGAIFGALALTILPNLLEDFEHAKHLAYGVTMVLVMMFAPNGLGDALFRLAWRAVVHKQDERA
jgi:branched-chain amino acid transport system permease protein